MNAKLIKPVVGELLDEGMVIGVFTADFKELEHLLSSRPESTFNLYQYFCARLFLIELGKKPSRN